MSLAQRSNVASKFGLLCLLLVHPIAVNAQTQFPAAQPCFDAATASAKCDTSSTATFNPCACSNTGNWLENSARCIGARDSGIVRPVYDALSTNCAGTNNPIVYSLEQWTAAAGRTVSSSIVSASTNIPNTATGRTVPTSILVSTVIIAPTNGQSAPVTSVVTLQPGQTSSVVLTIVSSGTTAVVTMAGGSQATNSSSSETLNEKSGLSAGAIVGTVVGILALLALIGLLIFIIMRKRKRDHEAQMRSHTLKAFTNDAAGATNVYPAVSASTAATTSHDMSTAYIGRPTQSAIYQQHEQSIYLHTPYTPGPTRIELAGHPVVHSSELPADHYSRH